MKILLNYADENYRIQRKYNSLSAKYLGNFDKIIETSFEDVEISFRDSNKDIFSIKRGAGLWLWKPYIIFKYLSQLDENDVLCYCDSGALFIRKIDYLIDFMNERHSDILLFDQPLLEKQFTKRKLYDLFSPKHESNQLLGGYMLLRKTDKTISFIKEWLDMCCDINCLYDDGKGIEYEDYVAHREDQAILSLLAHRYGIPSYREPSQYGKRPWEYMGKGRYYRCLEHKESTFPQILISCRKWHPLKYILFEIIKNILYSLKIFSEAQYLRKHSYELTIKNGEKYIGF